MKTRKFYLGSNTNDRRENLFAKYDDKYFNLFLSSRKWKGITRDAADFVMRRLWDTGIVGCYKIPVIGSPGFTTTAVMTRNQYWYPATLTLVNQNGASTKIIPESVMTVGKDVILCYALRSFTPYRFWIESQIEKIVEVEMTIYSNLFSMKNPVIIPVSSESKNKAQDYLDRIRNDEPALFVDSDSLDFKNISTGTNYLEELYAYKVQLENELLTYMGIDNIGNVEKKERLVKDEANSNNDLINDFGDNVQRNLDEFCQLANETFGFDISVEPTSTPAQAETETEEPENEKQ